MEPVTIMTEVWRGNRLLLRVPCNPRGAAIWSSPTPDMDIVTPEGLLYDIRVFPSLRRGSWREVPESLSLPIRSLSEGEAQDLDEELPF